MLQHEVSGAELNASGAKLLESVPPFDCASPLELEVLSRSLVRRLYQRGGIVYNQDDPPGSLYIIHTGLVKIQITSFDGKRVTIAWIAPGSFFGTLSLFAERVHPEDAVALDDTELYVLDRVQVHEFIALHPQAAQKLLEMLTMRWRRSLERLQDMVCLDVRGRLAKVLLEFPHRLDPQSRDGCLLTKRLTQGELASLLAISRESVNRCLRSFEREGLIEIEGGRIRIRCEPKLRWLYS